MGTGAPEHCSAGTSMPAIAEVTPSKVKPRSPTKCTVANALRPGPYTTEEPAKRLIVSACARTGEHRHKQTAMIRNATRITIGLLSRVCSPQENFAYTT